MQPSMRQLSLCCQSTTVADRLDLGVLWLHLPPWWWQSSVLSHLLPRVHWAAPDVWAVVVFLCCTVHPNTEHSHRPAHSPPSAFVELCGITFVSAGSPRRITFPWQSIKTAIIDWVQLLPSRFFCLLQRSDVQPASGLTGFGGHSE